MLPPVFLIIKYEPAFKIPAGIIKYEIKINLSKFSLKIINLFSKKSNILKIKIEIIKSACNTITIMTNLLISIFFICEIVFKLKKNKCNQKCIK